MVGLPATPTVSIIIPVYNSEKYLRACVMSVLAQHYRAIEVILIDDGSTDGSGAICDELATADDRVIVVHQKNGGIAAAQNSGLDAASGELVTFCDNDDLMSPRMIGRLVEILVSSGADMSCCRWYNVGASSAEALLAATAAAPDGDHIVFDQPGKYYQTVFSVALRRLARRELHYFSEANWGKLYRRSVFDGIRFPEGAYAQDVAVAMDLYGRMSSVASCDDRLYFWLQRPDSVSHGLRSTRYYHDIVRAHGRCFDLALQQGILPARAYFGMGAIRLEKRSILDAEGRKLYEADRRFVAERRAALTPSQRIRCAVLHGLRFLEVRVYNRTVHRRS